MRIDIVTVHPEMVANALEHSIIKRAMERGLMTINVVNLRDYTTDRHRTTDDTPYGGGGGMVMTIGPIARALEALKASIGYNLNSSETTAPGVLSIGQDAANVSSPPVPRIALTDPRGPRFTQATARRWAAEPHLILLCGHYEGVDERVRQHLVTDEISIGDFILTGGELPALVIADALTRLQPGALGDAEAPDKDTFEESLLEYPHYTRPREFNGWVAPDVLVNGHHALITIWRRWHQLRATRERRPDLFALLNLSDEDRRLIEAEEPMAPSDLKALRSRKKAEAKQRRDEAINTGERQTANDEGDELISLHPAPYTLHPDKEP